MIGIYGKDFAAIYDSAWYSYSRAVWPFISDQVRRRVAEPRTWLDLCCGSGHLLELLEGKAVRATGLDASPHQLAIARRSAASARLVRGDVRSFNLKRKFDVVTCLFDSLNYLTRKTDLSHTLTNVRRHLADGGLFIFDVNTFDGLEHGWRNVSVKRGERYTVIVEPSFNSASALGRVRITGFVKEGRRYRRFDEEHIQRGYHAREVADMLDRAGFSFRAYDGRTLAKPRPRSDRLLYVCSPERTS
jgi:SAM-dependent methyltransferase